MKMNNLKLFFLLACLMVSLTGHANPLLEKEIDRYIKVFSVGSIENRRAAIDDLAWSGITDQRLYDVIEQKLLDSYQDTKGNIDAAAWLAKTLAYSGEEKYRATLEMIVDTAKSTKIRKHTKIALETLPLYTQWNQSISKGTDDASTARELDSLRLSNMLQSSTPELIRYAAKRLYRHDRVEQKLFDEAEKSLLKYYNAPEADDGVWADALAWLCKALGNSRNSSYKETLQTVIENSGRGKVKSHAQKALKELS